MSSYDEKYFNAKANRRAGTTWFMLMIIVTIFYGVKMAQGEVGKIWFLIFSAIGWAEFIVGILLLKIKGMDFSGFKWLLALGYVLFYAIIAWTSMDQISYVFILPLISILILYKNPKLIMSMMWATFFVLVSSNMYKGSMKGMKEFVTSVDCALQFAIVICCYTCTNMAIKHLIESDGALMDSIKGNLERVVKTVEQVKGASNQIVDGVTVARELADENKAGAQLVVTNMNELSDANVELNERTMSSMEMTNVIDAQVGNVSDLMRNVVRLIETSVEHANISSDRLAEVVDTTNQMALLSAKIEEILGEFKEEFTNVKNETGVIEDITSQTDILALNASIEAARAGEAGKGFAVVAEEILGLSAGTQESSGRIFTALEHLEETSEKMLESINETIQLVQINMNKVASVDKSVTDITEVAESLGSNIRVVDRAVKEVENSNKTLTSNMNQVCTLMDVMTEKIDQAEVTTKEMLSKYDESAKSAENIESIVGHLMVELGLGGFMGVQDIRKGMKIAISFGDVDKPEYFGEVVHCIEKEIFVVVDQDLHHVINEKQKQMQCHLGIVVDNVLYRWTDIGMCLTEEGESGDYKLKVKDNPKVYNRRKYARMPLSNPCVIKKKGEDKLYHGKMVNLSANGFAFSSREKVFADLKGEDVIVDIKNLDVLNEEVLEGNILRVSDNEGEYIVGCRMPKDSKLIKEFVNKNYSE